MLWVKSAVVVVAILAGVIPATSAAAQGSECAAHNPFPPELALQLTTQYPDQRFSAAVYDRRTGCEYHFMPDERITTASVFKIEVMAGVLLEAQTQGRGLTAWEEARVWPMITESADPPTNELFAYLGGQAAFAALHEIFGLTETSIPPLKWGATSTSAADQVHLVRQVLLGEFGPLGEPYRELAWDMMTSVVPSQAWGISGGVSDRWTVALKNGFFPLSGPWRVNSSGFVRDLGGSGYAVTILSDGWPTLAAGIQVVEVIGEAVWLELAPLSAPDGLPFVDVADGDWFIDPVRWAYEDGVTYGISPIEFGPLRAVTRGETAAFLVRSFDLQAGPSGRFIDTAESVFVGDIDAIAAAGITFGCNPPSNERYCPVAPVTRGAIAAMLSRALDLPDAMVDAFTDDEGSVFEPDINRLAAAGIIAGCNPPANDEMCPHRPVTRAELVTFLRRIDQLTAS